MSGRESLTYRIATATDIGLKRAENQDHFGVEYIGSDILVVVCDGMGGPKGGRHASHTTVQKFTDAMRERTGPPAAILTESATEANTLIYNESQSNPDVQGMGTTLVAALLSGNRATIINIGDSRAYRFGSTGLRRISYDHSLVGQLVSEGKITEEEAEQHPQRNVITKAVGIRPEVEPDTFSISLEENDILLLSSDGLHAMISDARIEEILRSTSDPDATCKALIDAALEAGGKDNVTVALAYYGNRASSVSRTATAAVPARSGTSRILMALIALGILGTLAWLTFGEQVKRTTVTTLDSVSKTSFTRLNQHYDSLLKYRQTQDSIHIHDSLSRQPSKRSRTGLLMQSSRKDSTQHLGEER